MTKWSHNALLAFLKWVLTKISNFKANGGFNPLMKVIIRPIVCLTSISLLFSTSAIAEGDERKRKFREKIIEKFDTDGDGKLSKEERKALKEQRMLKRFDADGDGSLSEAEKATARETRKKMMEKFDVDGDGKLNQEEKAALRKEMRGKRKERKASL